MIPDWQIQADVVADLKAFTNLTALLAGADTAVKEDQYQGTVFLYPGIRVAIVQQTPLPDVDQCDLARLTAAVRCYAEGASSKVADTVAGVVNARLHRRYPFHGTGWQSFLRCEGLIGAIRVSERLWRAEVLFGGVVYPRAVP